MTSTAILINENKSQPLHTKTTARATEFLAGELSSGRDSQDLAALVKAARRADPVWDIRRGTLRTHTQLWQFQDAIISPAHALPACRWFAFRNTHKINAIK
jgi:hypothetical protein